MVSESAYNFVKNMNGVKKSYALIDTMSNDTKYLLQTTKKEAYPKGCMMPIFHNYKVTTAVKNMNSRMLTTYKSLKELETEKKQEKDKKTNEVKFYRVPGFSHFNEDAIEKHTKNNVKNIVDLFDSLDHEILQEEQEKEQAKREEMKKRVHFYAKLAQDSVTVDNLDDKIQECLSGVKSYNFAIDGEGNKIHGNPGEDGQLPSAWLSKGSHPSQTEEEIYLPRRRFYRR